MIIDAFSLQEGLYLFFLLLTNLFVTQSKEYMPIHLLHESVTKKNYPSFRLCPSFSVWTKFKLRKDYSNWITCYLSLPISFNITCSKTSKREKDMNTISEVVHWVAIILIAYMLIMVVEEVSKWYLIIQFRLQ
jgi:hypothetical protein